MLDAELVAALDPVVQVLARLAVPHYVGGSVASSAHGVMRTTRDVDLIAALGIEHVGALVEDLGATYYLDAEAATDAILRGSSFNLLHLATMFKIDVFVPNDDSYAREALNRRQEGRLEGRFPVASPEDVILSKLRWYRQGGEVSEQQWSDVMGVMKVQAGALDGPYMRQWAEYLGVGDLLERAVDEAGR